VIKLLYEKAKQYAEDVVSGKQITTDEVTTQCRWFLEDLELQDDPEFEFYLDYEKIEVIEGLLSLLNFATGINGVIGKTILEGLVDFQAFFLFSIFGWRLKENHDKFRYKDNTLFIPRKNAKTFLCALIIIILMLTEEDFSEFYSICKDRSLAAETKKAIIQIITASPAIQKYFNVPKSLNGKIDCSITKSFYQPRTAEANRNNAIKPSAFVADEIRRFYRLCEYTGYEIWTVISIKPFDF